MRQFLGKDFMRLTGRQDDLKFKLSVFSLTRFLCRNRLISVGLSDPPFLMLSTLLSNFCSEKTYFCSEKETYNLFLCSDAYINFLAFCVFSIICQTRSFKHLNSSSAIQMFKIPIFQDIVPLFRAQ